MLTRSQARVWKDRKVVGMTIYNPCCGNLSREAPGRRDSLSPPTAAAPAGRPNPTGSHTFGRRVVRYSIVEDPPQPPPRMKHGAPSVPGVIASCYGCGGVQAAPVTGGAGCTRPSPSNPKTFFGVYSVCCVPSTSLSMICEGHDYQYSTGL